MSRYLIYCLCLVTAINAQDVLCTFEKDKNVNLFSQQKYNLYYERCVNDAWDTAPNGQTEFYMISIKKVKTGKLYALLHFDSMVILVEYKLKNGEVDKLEKTKGDFYKFDFVQNTVTELKDIDDNIEYDEQDVIDRINALLE